MNNGSFKVNNLGSDCWLFEGPSMSGKTDLTKLMNFNHDVYPDYRTLEIVEVPNLDRIDIFERALKIQVRPIKYSKETYTITYIFITKSHMAADYIRNYFYSREQMKKWNLGVTANG